MNPTKNEIPTTPTDARAQALFSAELHLVHCATDRVFRTVLFLQWLAGIGLGLWFTPKTWVSDVSYIHPHLWQATVWGGIVISLPCFLVTQQPGRLFTRVVICAAQAVSSGLLIHLMDGRIESHFHIFVSLALLAFYRDWRVLVLFSGLAGIDHLVRGIWLPLSVYGTDVSDPWRFLEHVGWVLTEDLLLVMFCRQSIAEMRMAADRQARFEFVNSSFESAIEQRTESLRRNEERFNLALRGSKTGIYDWDLKTNWVHVSAQVAEILGIDPGEQLHKFHSLMSRLHPEDEKNVLAAINDAVATKKSLQQEFRLRRETGEYAWVECRGECSTDSYGRVYRLAGGIRDITGRKQIQAELAEREAKLRNSQKLEAVGALAGGIAHEFNNLLQAIRGYTELARSGLATTDRRFEDLGEVLVAADRAASLTRQLLGFSRNHALERRTLCPADIIEDLTRMIRPLIGEQIQVVTDVAGDLGTISADPVLVQQLFLNLCINARDAMSDGGCLKLAVNRVQSCDDNCDSHLLKNAGSYVHFTVSDNGCGIDPEIQQRIFEPFFTTKEFGKGTGLGLSMVYGVVEQHEGAIHVDSEPGRGTTFHIYLPNSSESLLVDIESAHGNSTKGAETILIAEDETMVRTLLTRILSGAGYSVLAASDGVEAVEIYAANQTEISLVVLDAIMPRLSGHDVVALLRTLDSEIPILLCTGYDPATGRLESMADQEIRVVEKPFDPEKLLRAVRETLDRQRVKEPVL